MEKKFNIVPWVGVALSGIALFLVVILFGRNPTLPAPVKVPESSNAPQHFAGAAGNLLAEQYEPYVQYNGGYYSNLSFALGTTTPASIIAIGRGRCNLTAGNGNGQTTMSASTTQMHYCSAPGVRPGDQLIITMPASVPGFASSSPLTGYEQRLSIEMVGAAATTSDIIGILLSNKTGIATTSYSQATTGVLYMFVR